MNQCWLGFLCRSLLMLGIVGFLNSALSQEKPDPDSLTELKKRIERLEKKQADEAQSLMDEISNLKSEVAVPELGSGSFMGMGQGASKVYFSKNQLSIGGYGEVVFTDPRGGSGVTTTDNYRFVPYISYRFNDWIIFNSEIEFEHVSKLAVEFSYVDLLFRPEIGLRVGHVLVPVGMTNLKHEPVYFASVLRPELETKLIPSTWHDNGVLLHGQIGNIRYQAGVLNSMKASSNMKASSWIRGARQWQDGKAAEAEDLAGVIRIDWLPTAGFELGGSFYSGEIDQSQQSIGSPEVQLWEIHSEYVGKGFELEAIYAQGTLSDAGQLSTVDNVIGEQASGYYVTLGYDWWNRKKTGHKLVSFARYSEYDLNDKVADGFVKDESVAKEIWTLGLNYLPHPQVIFKGDYQSRKTKKGDEDDRLALGVGFVF